MPSALVNQIEKHQPPVGRDSYPPFVDPRLSPLPPYPYSRTLASDASEVADLVQFCRQGRVYAVEEWIKCGKPLWTANDRLRGTHRLDSPLAVAIESGQFDLAVLLLCNGFPAETERESLLGRALDRRALRFVDLLLQWGANPRRVYPHSIFDTYDRSVYDRFWELGADFTIDHALAYELALASSNRPLYGWARRNRDDERIARELGMALGKAVIEDRERAVALLLWAGADPHRPYADLRDGGEDEPELQSTAIELAVAWGRGRLLPLLKPEVSRDNFVRLWSSVSDRAAVDYLVQLQGPSDWSAAILCNVRQLTWGFTSRWDARICIERVAALGGRLTTVSDEEISDLRRRILRSENHDDMRWLLWWLRQEKHADRRIHRELMRTEAMQSRFAVRAWRRL